MHEKGLTSENNAKDGSFKYHNLIEHLQLSCSVTGLDLISASEQFLASILQKTT
jgi:hypothetical protein